MNLADSQLPAGTPSRGADERTSLRTESDSVLPRPPEATSRLVSLDGLRGVAALIVACHHFCCAFAPRLVAGLTSQAFWITNTPAEILLNGAFSVSIFFVLSGFVVARAASRARDSVLVNIVARYFRLAVPVAASVVFAWALLTWLPDAATRLNEMHPSPWLSGTFQHQIPAFSAAVSNGFLGVFGFDPFHRNLGSTGLNNALWTMRVELDGSVAIYLYYGVARGWMRWIVGGLIAVEIVRRPIFLSFLLGAVMMECWTKGKLSRGHGMAALVLGILLGFPEEGFSRFGVSALPYLLRPGSRDGLVPSLAAALILYAVLNSTLLDRWLSAVVPVFLGRVSFPLYLIHVPLLYTVFAMMFVRINPATPYFLGVYLLIFLGVSLAIAVAGEKWIDNPVLRLISMAKKRVRRKRSNLTEPGYSAG